MDRYAQLYDRSFLVIIDEFQNTREYIYRDRECRTARDSSIPGTWHDLSESKQAPMLVTGSYVGWMINIILIITDFGEQSFQIVEIVNQ